MSEYEPESGGTFQDSRPPLQSHVDPSGKTTSISCERGGCAVAVVDTVVTALVAVGVVVLPHAVRTSAKALSAMRATPGVKRRAFTLATLSPSVACRAETGNFGAEVRTERHSVGHPSPVYLLLLHHAGRRSGRRHVLYVEDAERYVLIGSNGGADTEPAWVANVAAMPEVVIEVGAQT